jgi:hypothetical protein
VWHDGRDLPPCHSAAGSWRQAAPLCRQKQAPVAVPHVVRDLTPRGRAAGATVGYGARCAFLEFFYSTIYFSKIMTK